MREVELSKRRMPRCQAERSRSTREHLIATTIDVVRERSYQGATVFEVAKAAGVTPGALQHHFGSKAVLMMRVVDEMLRNSAGKFGNSRRMLCGTTRRTYQIPCGERQRCVAL